jgi:maleate isomerase
MDVIGLIVPSSNTVMEEDFHRRFQRPVVVTTTRIFLEDVTREAELRMLSEDLPQALRLIATAAPRIVVFGCTSAGSLGGIEHDSGIARSIEQVTGASAITVIGAVVNQLRTLGARRVAVLTPYSAGITQSVADCIVEAGFEVVKSAGMGIVSNREIGRVTPDEVAAFVEREFQGAEADCAFLSCTNWRAVEAMEALQQALGVPVVTSNQACIEKTGSSLLISAPQPL